MELGVVVPQRRPRTGSIDLPRRSAGHHPAQDRSQAGTLLVALSISEFHATGPAIPAITVGATAVAVHALRSANTPTVAAARAVVLVAIEVVPRQRNTIGIAETGSVGLPPAGCDCAWWAAVRTREGATELGVPPTTQITAVAVLAATLTYRCVRGAGFHNVRPRCNGESRTDRRYATEQSPSTHTCADPPA